MLVDLSPLVTWRLYTSRDAMTSSRRLSVYESVFRDDVKRVITGTLHRDVRTFVKAAYVSKVSKYQS